MPSKQVVLSGVIGAALICVLCIPVASLAFESQANAPSPEKQVETVAANTNADARSTGNSVLPDLKRGGKSDPKEDKSDKDQADQKDSSSKSEDKQLRKAAHTLTAVKPHAQDAPSEAEKKAPIPSDAMVGIKNLKRQHQDIPTERMVASIGEQARYIGLKDGIPGSILIAKTVIDKGTHVSAETLYREYGEYVEACSRNLTRAYAKSSGSSLAKDLSYDTALNRLQEEGILSNDEVASIASMIERYDLDRYDEPLSYTVTGVILDAGTGEPRSLDYSDYVNLERIVTSYIGTPYVWGGSTEFTGFDCSGLVQWSCSKALNIGLPRTTYVQQYVGESVPLDIDELRMGDLLFFYTPGEGTHHVAMYLADGYYIHAPCSGDVVKITSMDEFAPTFARRVITFEDIDDDKPMGAA